MCKNILISPYDTDHYKSGEYKEWGKRLAEHGLTNKEVPKGTVFGKVDP